MEEKGDEEQGDGQDQGQGKSQSEQASVNDKQIKEDAATDGEVEEGKAPLEKITTSRGTGAPKSSPGGSGKFSPIPSQRGDSSWKLGQQRQASTLDARRLRDAEEQRKTQVTALHKEIERLKQLVDMKDERIGDMSKELVDMNESTKLHVEQLHAMEEAAKKPRFSETELENQLKQSEEEFDLLSEAMEEKDKEIKKLQRTMTDLRLENQKLENEVARQKTILHRNTGAAVQKKESEDVCLSARSFCENELISLRDEAIQVKEKQIAIINANNARLNENINHVEGELEKMQFELFEKDKTIQKLRADNQAAADLIVELKRKAEIKEGKDEAMEVATNQNAQLLQLLQQQEKLNSDLERRSAILAEQVEDLKRKTRTTMARSAEYEVQATTEKQETLSLKKELMTVRSSWEAEESMLRNRLSKLEKESSATIEAQREELRMRREKHYEMLSKLQLAEAAARAAEDRVYEMQCKVEGIESKNRELEERYFDLEKWCENQSRRHQSTLGAVESSHRETKSKVAQLENEKRALSTQLQEMSSTVIRAVEKQNQAIDKAVEAKSEIDERQAQLESMKKRMIKEGNLQGKRRMKVELEQRILAEQLDSLRDENVRLAQATNANFEDQERRADALEKRTKKLELQLEQAQEAQENRLLQLIRFADASCFIFENEQYIFNLEGCRLGASLYLTPEQSRSSVQRLSRHLALMLSESNAKDAPLVLKLGNNAFDDSHVPNGLGKIVQASFRAKSVTIDLSKNHLSSDGIRALVLSLGKNRHVQHVFVHRDGTVQGLRGSEVVYTIDLKDNSSDSSNSYLHQNTEDSLHLVSPESPAPRNRKLPALGST